MAQTFFAGVTGLAILFNEEITNIKKKISDDIYYTFYRDIKINKEQSPKTVFAIKEHLSYKSLTFQEIEIIRKENLIHMMLAEDAKVIKKKEKEKGAISLNTIHPT